LCHKPPNLVLFDFKLGEWKYSVTHFIFKVSKSAEVAKRRADVKETAGYAIRSKTAIDIFGAFLLVSDFKQYSY